MKTKLVAILTILLFSGMFSACTEEEINPDTNIHAAKNAGVTQNTSDSTNF